MSSATSTRSFRASPLPSFGDALLGRLIRLFDRLPRLAYVALQPSAVPGVVALVAGMESAERDEAFRRAERHIERTFLRLVRVLGLGSVMLPDCREGPSRSAAILYRREGPSWEIWASASGEVRDIAEPARFPMPFGTYGVSLDAAPEAYAANPERTRCLELSGATFGMGALARTGLRTLVGGYAHEVASRVFFIALARCADVPTRASLGALAEVLTRLREAVSRGAWASARLGITVARTVARERPFDGDAPDGWESAVSALMEAHFALGREVVEREFVEAVEATTLCARKALLTIPGPTDDCIVRPSKPFGLRGTPGWELDGPTFAAGTPVVLRGDGLERSGDYVLFPAHVGAAFGYVPLLAADLEHHRTFRVPTE